MIQTFTPPTGPFTYREKELVPPATFVTTGTGNVIVRVDGKDLVVAYIDMFAFIAHIVRNTKVLSLQRASDEEVLGVKP